MITTQFGQHPLTYIVNNFFLLVMRTFRICSQQLSITCPTVPTSTLYSGTWGSDPTLTSLLSDFRLCLVNGKYKQMIRRGGRHHFGVSAPLDLFQEMDWLWGYFLVTDHVSYHQPRLAGNSLSLSNSGWTTGLLCCSSQDVPPLTDLNDWS